MSQTFSQHDWIEWEFQHLPEDWKMLNRGILFKENVVKLWLEREATLEAYQ